MTTPVLLPARLSSQTPQIHHLTSDVPNRPQVSGDDRLIVIGIDPSAYARPAP